MGRRYFVNGETMVYVKGCSSTAIGSLQELGLAQGPINISFDYRSKDVSPDAWGNEIPNDVQSFLSAATITMDLIHYDPNILEVCLTESLAGAPAAGQQNHAGALMGNGQPRFTGGQNGNHFIGLNLASPIGQIPWCFLFSYLQGNPVSIPLGTEKSITRCTWRAIPYSTDPWGTGLGAYGVQWYSHVLDT